MNIKVVSEDVLPPVMGTTDPLFVVAENSLDPSEMMTVASFASSDLLNPIPTAGEHASSPPSFDMSQVM